MKGFVLSHVEQYYRSSFLILPFFLAFTVSLCYNSPSLKTVHRSTRQEKNLFFPAGRPTKRSNIWTSTACTHCRWFWRQISFKNILSPKPGRLEKYTVFHSFLTNLNLCTSNPRSCVGVRPNLSLAMYATRIIQWRDCGRVPWEDKWEELSAELMVLVSFYSTWQLKVLSFCLGQNNFSVLCQSPCERVCPSRYPRILSLCTARLSTSVPSVPGNRLGWTELCTSICQSCKHTHTQTQSHIFIDH